VLAVLVNPWGWRTYTYVWSIGNNPVIRRTIEEWQAPSLMSLPGALFFGSVVAFMAAVALSPVRLSLRDLLRIGVAFVLGLTGIRNGLWWTFAAAPALATLLSPLGERWRASARTERPSLVNSIVVTALLVLLVMVSPWARHRSPLIAETDRALVSNDTPVAAAQFLNTHEMPGNMLNAQRFGSYLEWAAPGDRTFIDSRIELFSPGLWSDYGEVMRAQQGWQETLERYDVGYVVLETRPRAELADALESAGWHEVFRDADATIYVRPNHNAPT
jgi:hypothetical protein